MIYRLPAGPYASDAKPMSAMTRPGKRFTTDVLEDLAHEVRPTTCAVTRVGGSVYIERSAESVGKWVDGPSGCFDNPVYSFWLRPLLFWSLGIRLWRSIDC